MKALRFLLMTLSVTSILSCTKEEPVNQAEFDPVLKAPACTPNVINYNDRDTVAFPPGFPVYLPGTCIPEPVYITLYDIQSKGHTNVSASCRFNDHAKLTIHITATGFFTQNLYDSYSVSKHHYIGSITGQGAQVIREDISSELVNLTTGETFEMNQTFKQVINANGDVVVSDIEFLPCE
jgi:hypothetical protein